MSLVSTSQVRYLAVPVLVYHTDNLFLTRNSQCKVEQ